jgi:hypothetical protein
MWIRALAWIGVGELIVVVEGVHSSAAPAPALSLLGLLVHPALIK